ncbi:transcriptional regulator PpsR [Dongia mobilis]|uniref:Transcriptional regulator PpsR n=1 Tax=Dongia mobilis TaxID=578943 RepID=A0A4R6WP51_9PROT|nr:transcriptional regulator PpsR [Dongia mobilis]TDQ82964.1 transcriptional regulator PpsR [Dongia mobilis]
MSIGRPDVTLLLDKDGIIRDVTLSDAEPKDRALDLIGQPWVDTVADLGGDKVRSMVEDARASRVSAFRQVTQRLPGGREILLEFTTVRLEGSAGFIAVGRSLQAVADLQSKLIAAQQAMERDYWKLRQVESRYRILFDASAEAVVLIRAIDLRIVEANPAALRALGLAAQKGKAIAGRELLPELAAEDRESFQAALAQAREQGRAPGILLHLGREAQPWIVRVSLLTAEAGPLYMLQFAPTGVAVNGGDLGEAVSTEDLIERVPDGFVVIDEDGIVVRANRAFLDLVQVGGRGTVAGERLSRWLGRPGADLTVLLSTVRQHGVVRMFSTTLHGELGLDTEIEISAVGAYDPSPKFIGVLIRDVSRRLSQTPVERGPDVIHLPAAEEIGRSTLRKLVKQTVQMVERHYVEAALRMTGDNRTAAAELLGLSRQNLYAKLDRYGLTDRADASDRDA